MASGLITLQKRKHDLSSTAEQKRILKAVLEKEVDEHGKA